MARQPGYVSLGVLARMPVAQLDPVHETGARLFKRDRSCWKVGFGRRGSRTPTVGGRVATSEDGCGPSAAQRPARARSHVGVLASYLDYAPAVAGL